MIKLMNRRSVRRLLIAVAALVLISVPVVAQIQFSDVPDDNPHRDNINYVAEQKWFVGYKDGSYKPDQNITPSEMTRVLWRAFDEGITRAEFASFLVAGNVERRRPSQENPLGYLEFGRGSNTYIIAYDPEFYNWLNREWYDYGAEAIWSGEDPVRFIEPGRYLIPSGCRWMRLSHIPSGEQSFDTIAGTEAALAGYFQGEKTTEAHIIEIEITDFAFMADC